MLDRFREYCCQSMTTGNAVKQKPFEIPLTIFQEHIKLLTSAQSCDVICISASSKETTNIRD